jgi:hypothetical protein
MSQDKRSWNMLDRVIVKEILAFIPYKINMQNIPKSSTPLIFKESLFSFVITHVIPQDLLFLLDHCSLGTAYYHVMLDHEKKRSSSTKYYTSSTPKKIPIPCDFSLAPRNLFQYGKWTVHLPLSLLEIFLNHEQFYQGNHTLQLRVAPVNIVENKSYFYKEPFKQTSLVQFDKIVYKDDRYSCVPQQLPHDLVPILLPKTQWFSIGVKSKNDEENKKMVKSLLLARHVKSIAIECNKKDHLSIMCSYFEQYEFALQRIKLNGKNQEKQQEFSSVSVWNSTTVEKYGMPALLFFLLNKYGNKLKHVYLKKMYLSNIHNWSTYFANLHSIRLKRINITNEQRIMLIKLAKQEYSEQECGDDSDYDSSDSDCYDDIKELTIPFSNELEEALRETKARVLLGSTLSFPPTRENNLSILNIPSLKRVHLKHSVSLSSVDSTKSTSACPLQSFAFHVQSRLSLLCEFASQVQKHANKGYKIKQLEIECESKTLDLLTGNHDQCVELLSKMLEKNQDTVFKITAQWA